MVIKTHMASQTKILAKLMAKQSNLPPSPPIIFDLLIQASDRAPNNLDFCLLPPLQRLTVRQPWDMPAY